MSAIFTSAGAANVNISYYDMGPRIQESRLFGKVINAGHR